MNQNAAPRRRRRKAAFATRARRPRCRTRSRRPGQIGRTLRDLERGGNAVSPASRTRRCLTDPHALLNICVTVPHVSRLIAGVVGRRGSDGCASRQTGCGSSGAPTAAIVTAPAVIAAAGPTRAAAVPAAGMPSRTATVPTRSHSSAVEVSRPSAGSSAPGLRVIRKYHCCRCDEAENQQSLGWSHIWTPCKGVPINPAERASFRWFNCVSRWHKMHAQKTRRGLGGKRGSRPLLSSILRTSAAQGRYERVRTLMASPHETMLMLTCRRSRIGEPVRQLVHYRETTMWKTGVLGALVLLVAVPANAAPKNSGKNVDAIRAECFRQANEAAAAGGANMTSGATAARNSAGYSAYRDCARKNGIRP